MKEIKLDISEEAFSAALKRHEDEFEKELKEVDVRKITLKTKKALLEQARITSNLKTEATTQMYQIRQLESEIKSTRDMVRNLSYEQVILKQTFSEAVKLINAENNKKGLLTKLKEWLF